jgi:hypothetical protein
MNGKKVRIFNVVVMATGMHLDMKVETGTTTMRIPGTPTEIRTANLPN